EAVATALAGAGATFSGAGAPVTLAFAINFGESLTSAWMVNWVAMAWSVCFGWTLIFHSPFPSGSTWTVKFGLAEVTSKFLAGKSLAALTEIVFGLACS